MAAKFFKSSKGKDMLSFHGYLYVQDKSCDTKVYWKCANFKKFSCKGRAIQRRPEEVKETGEHNHAGEAAVITAKEAYSNMKEAAVRTRDTPHYIISNSSCQLHFAASSQLPSIESMKRTIRNVRLKKNSEPTLPKTRAEIQFPDEYRKTDNGEDFLLFDSGYA
ncbi:FLYWCH-type zinc finger-containing protein 1-like [Diabrotica virgifera virgifera]|uniref:FLYWCH-type domain-containing protein n=1 Tax=Diabrotica virgifera virgifera TaxID=50390 RepID=A0ABM5JSW0_DIAVI|nr:FLYWCH-type zinc finger-containing protein 1-like [Diabrotica virgifera virgifera]